MAELIKIKHVLMLFTRTQKTVCPENGSLDIDIDVV